MPRPLQRKHQKMENDTVIQKVKAWLTPILLTLVGGFLMNDIHEMKTDIKKLLELSSADQIRLEYLEKEVDALKGRVYTTNNKPIDNNNDYPKEPTQLIAIIPGKDNDDKPSDRKL